ncbi:lipase family protein [Collimonas fungivorans]|uniref:Secretory lipase n=1 Tax=Collimonas fungivorans (strain Ter331) TaxID=1005048 RepID=G0A8T2_COLFT|nr:lipase family protein [Collimonas fungivorans]AEK61795.1 secretory lipase [Collimonas fungivorans Ter331]
MRHTQFSHPSKLVAAALLGLALCACGGGGDDNVVPQSKAFTADGGVSAFYRWNAVLPSAPGVLLQQEPLPASQVLPNASQAVRILYSSTDGDDGKTAIYVSGDLQLPKGAPPVGGWPLIAWAHGTVGVADVCAPSWTVRDPRDVDYLDAWLAQGYAVVSTDYQGLGTPGLHPYLHARPEAYSVLDSIRAVSKNFPQLSSSVVIVGQSQGAQGAIATAAYAPSYAPEIKLLGTVATGVPYQLQSVLAYLNALTAQVPTNGFTSVLGTLEAYAWLGYATAERVVPGFLLSDHLTAKGKTFYAVAASQCLGPIEDNIMQNKLVTSDVFNGDVTAWATQTLQSSNYPTVKFAAPVFVGTGTLDTDIPTAVQYLFAKDACAAGSTIEQHYYPGQTHDSTVLASLADSKPFVQKLFAGLPVTSNCAALTPPP